METTLILVLLIATVALSGGLWLLVRRFRKTHHQLTAPELRNRALEESESLAEMVNRRELHRPADETGTEDRKAADPQPTPYDEETREIYQREHMPKITDLREHFAARRIRNHMLDDLYANAEDEADLRTISTALQEMAGRV